MSEQDLELLITLDDPVDAQEEDTFNHLQVDIQVCTVTHWKNGKIVEQKVFYDLVGMQKQIGIM